jgi:hypothetical protein
MIENAELVQNLHERDEELKRSKQATRKLAAWTLNERNRLMTEVHHQQLLSEYYENILKQRDEQLLHLLTLHQQDKVEHARTWKILGRPVPLKFIPRINETRQQIGWPPIDQQGVIMDISEGNNDGKTCFSTGGERVCDATTPEKEGLAGNEGENYSPPDAGGCTSIIDQVDELITEERSKMIV